MEEEIEEVIRKEEEGEEIGEGEVGEEGKYEEEKEEEREEKMVRSPSFIERSVELLLTHKDLEKKMSSFIQEHSEFFENPSLEMVPLSSSFKLFFF